MKEQEEEIRDRNEGVGRMERNWYEGVVRKEEKQV